MSTCPKSRPILLHPSFLVAFVLLGLTSCTTARVAEGGPSSGVEPVEIGYGSADSGQLTGSSATLHSEDLKDRQPQTLMEMLIRIPGVRVMEKGDRLGGVSVRVRGANNSFQGGEEPLFVLDGMPISFNDGELRSINPSVIESITVLKDAGATAIYGSRGANGVILIKTKGGSV
jgi:TonB-dependent SusC/RagA subfamily outer membrane receptor